ncbi:MAG: YigZ family protein [Bradymonadales bacterium]
MLHLSEIASFTNEIKKSRFIATCAPVQSVEEAELYIKNWHQADARHNCWAYRIGEQYRFFDDGEPGGSAGRPILAAIDGMGFDAVVAHVVRYFGGIKLGVGGLVRAYGNTVKQALQNAESHEFIPMQELAFRVDFADTYAVYGIINASSAQKLRESYVAEGVEFYINVKEDELENYRDTLSNATQGRVYWLGQN